jgi:hypothetical protein
MMAHREENGASHRIAGHDFTFSSGLCFVKSGQFSEGGIMMKDIGDKRPIVHDSVRNGWGSNRIDAEKDSGS